MTQKLNADNGLQRQTTRTSGYTSLPKEAVQCSTDTFVVNQSWFSISTFVVKIATFAKPETVISNVRQQNPNSAIRQLMTNCKRNWQKAQKQRIVVEKQLKVA